MAHTRSGPTSEKPPKGEQDKPLSDAEMGDKEAGGLAGQGGMRDPDKTSDPDRLKPS